MTATTSEPVPIANSQLRRIRSSIVGQDYLIKVRLPETYAENTKAYPVLYLLDGDHAFAMATDVVQYLIYSQRVPDLIIVSPAYGSKSQPSEGGTNMRGRDLAPFSWPGMELTPGAPQFLQFLQQELMPYVESNYRIDSRDRTLWGYSLGGMFGLYALFQSPQLFKRYIIIDGFDERFIEMEELYATQQTHLPSRLFVAAPPGNWGSRLSLLVDTLKGRRHSGLELEFEQLSDIGHFAIGAEGLAKGLLSVFHK